MLKMHNQLMKLYNTFKQIGKLTHHEKQAEQLVEETKDNIDKVIDSIPAHHKKSKVFIEVSSKPEIYIQGSIHSSMIC